MGEREVFLAFYLRGILSLSVRLRQPAGGAVLSSLKYLRGKKRSRAPSHTNREKLAGETEIK